MRRPQRTTLDPRSMDYGEIAKQTAIEDRYFDNDRLEALALILDHLVDQLIEPDQSAVRMCVMANLSYPEAGRLLGNERGGKPYDPKTVWRWARRGVLQLKEWLTASEWLSDMTGGRIPLPDDEALLTLGGGGLEDALDRQLEDPEEEPA